MQGNVKVIRTVEDFGLKSRPYVRNYGLKVEDILPNYLQLYDEILASDGSLSMTINYLDAKQPLNALTLMEKKLVCGVILCLEFIENDSITFELPTTGRAAVLGVVSSVRIPRYDKPARYMILAVYCLEVLKVLEVFRYLRPKI